MPTLLQKHPTRQKRTALITTALLAVAFTTFVIQRWADVNLLADATALRQDIGPYEMAEFRSTDLPSRRWLTFAMELVKLENFAPATAARFYAYVASAYADALAATGSAEQAGAATAAMLNTLAPQHRTKIDTAAGLLNHVVPLTAAAEEVLGRYLERAATDGAGLAWDGTVPPSEHRWFARGGKIDAGAMAGQWQTWLLAPNDSFAIPPPPEYGSMLDRLELEKVRYAVARRHAEDEEALYFWQGAHGFEKGARHDNITPAGVWQNILFIEYGRQRVSDAEYAGIQKILAESLADSFTVAWRVKYQYWTQRPSMRIEDLPILFNDPPFPSYVSGHSAISATAATVLSALRPDQAETWRANADDAAHSRLLAGIHFDVDNRVGKELGDAIGKTILARLNGAPPPEALFTSPPDLLRQVAELAFLRLQPRIAATAGTVRRTIRRWVGMGTFQNVIAASGIAPRGAAGAAWGDYDRDGDLDLFTPPRLWRNNGNGTFTEATTAAGIPDRPYGAAGIFGDYNNDDCPDIYLSRDGPQEPPTATGERDALYQSNCDGTFTDVSNIAGIRDAYHGQGVAWADYDRDGWLDIYVANHGTVANGDGQTEPNLLYRNNGDGTFADVSATAGVIGTTQCRETLPPAEQSRLQPGKTKFSYQPLWFDYDNDGWLDLYVTNDIGTSPLYRNNGDGTFADVTRPAGLCRFGTFMGVSVADYDGDGDLDLYVTDTGRNHLWENNGNGTFSEAARAAGVLNAGSLGWGAEFVDFDNDGLMDLWAVNGTVLDEVRDRIKSHQDRLFRNTGTGRFADVAEREGVWGDDPKLAAAFGDYDQNGFVDGFIVSDSLREREATEPMNRLYRNRGNSNRWLAIRLVGTTSNRMGIGARITVHANGIRQVQEVTAGSSFLSQKSPWPLFGLGRAAEADEIEIRWPSGILQRLKNVPADQTITVREA